MMGEAVQQFEMLSDTQQAQVLRLTMDVDQSLAEVSQQIEIHGSAVHSA